MDSKTYIPKQNEIQQKWLLVDAKDQILGRLATRVAGFLIGKSKTNYTPHLDCGDHVVVVNAKKIRVSGSKAKTKMYGHYTGYPGGLRQYSFETLMTKKPEDRYSDPEEWELLAPHKDGSWWPEWVAWLDTRSGAPIPPSGLGAPQAGYEPLCDAPGTYVLQD